MTYAKLNGGTLEYLPRILATPNGQVVNPTEEDIKDAGFKPVVDEPPQTAPNEIATRTGWVETEKEIRGRYEIHDRPPEVHVYDVCKLIRNLKSAGYWKSVWSWIERNDLIHEWNACSSFSENDEGFKLFFPKIIKDLGFPNDAIIDIMKASEAE